MLTNPDFALHADFAADAQSAARRLKVTLTPVEVRSPDDIEGAFSAMAAAKAEAVLILGQPFLIAHGARVAKLAMEQRLPTMVPFDGVVDEGILMSYGAKIEDDVRLVPRYIDRILKGANPADLPVEQPSRFYLTINLKTAKTIGVAMPASLRQRADRLVE
jgi:putative ABC transport system substrate-binding protein